MRYLYDTTSKDTRSELRQELAQIAGEVEKKYLDKREAERSKLIRRFYVFKTLERLALIFLSPILAIAIWLLLSQLGLQVQQTNQGQTGIFLMAAISFTIGLVTNEAVNSLIAFANSVLSRSSDAGKNEDSPKPNNQKSSATNNKPSTAASSHTNSTKRGGAPIQR